MPDDCIQKKFITNLPNKVWEALVVKLDPPRKLGGDFKDLAGEMGFNTDQILYFKSLKNPTETILNGCSSHSIEDLCNKLDVIGRGDARLEIDKWIKAQDCKCALCAGTVKTLIFQEPTFSRVSLNRFLLKWWFNRLLISCKKIMLLLRRFQ